MIAPKKIDGRYENWLPTPMMAGDRSLWSVTWQWIRGGDREKPDGVIPVVPLQKEDFGQPAEGLAVRWLGHSSALIEINGRRVLIDPVFNKHASPIPGFTKRFSEAPVKAQDLPAIDAVIISHDHYDHLEKGTVIALAGKNTTFFAPKGVAHYLKSWGVESSRIRELSWWEESPGAGVTFICVPARHFSGRGLFDRNETLWAGWIIRSAARSVYYSGDTGYAGHFSAIGERFGPFDLTLIKIGAYNDAWPDIHLDPEQAVQAHREVKGKVLLPVHWATFPLALHPWDEPIVRAIRAGKENGVAVITPMIGELVDLEKPRACVPWWEKVR